MKWWLVLVFCKSIVEGDMSLTVTVNGKTVTCINNYGLPVKLTCKFTGTKGWANWFIEEHRVAQCGNVCIPPKLNGSNVTFSVKPDAKETYLNIASFMPNNEQNYTCEKSTDKKSTSVQKCNPVESVGIQLDGNDVGKEIKIVSGSSITLTCVTNPVNSRPTPTIEWFIGTEMRQSATIVTFVYSATKYDHNETVCCKAYNTNADDAKESEKPRLYVQVKVTSVRLFMGDTEPSTNENVKVIAGKPENFTCIPGFSRPPAEIDWYIRETMRKSSSHIFTLNASDADHNGTIYCKARNIPGTEVVSEKPTLFVKVQIADITLKQGGRTVSSENATVTAGVAEIFTCKPGLSRPVPTIDWYIGSAMKKSSSETIFNLTAVNADHGKKIYCKAYNLQTENEGVLSSMPALYVQVPVSVVTIGDGSRNFTRGETLNVSEGVNITLTCATGLSRPPSTIIWNLGSFKQTPTGSSFTFTPKDINHNQYIYCSAYNIQPKVDAVSSEKTKLYVRVQVKDVTLKKGDSQPDNDENVTVTAGVPTTFICTPGHSRPSPTIDWYVGSTLRQSAKSNNFTLIPVSTDHREEIFCIAYNLQPNMKGVLSKKPKLYVQVIAETPSIVNGTNHTITLLESESYYLECYSTETRPAAIMIWKIGTRTLHSSEFIVNKGPSELVMVKSTVSLNVSRDENNANISCESKIATQISTPKTEKILAVLWRPDRPVVRAVNRRFPWTEGQEGELQCFTNDLGNPNSTIIWINEIGKANDQNHLVMSDLNYLDNGRVVKCQMENTFTLAKSLNIESEESQLEIQFSPKFFMPTTVFVGKPYENITIPVPFLVNPTNVSVKLLVNNTGVINYNKYRLVTGEAIIKIDSLETSVDLKNGYHVNLTIFNLDEADFTVYVLHISNAINSSTISVSVTAESKPLLPTSFKLLEQTVSRLVLYWERGFNGGHIQTFWLQVTEAGADNWKNKTVVDEFDNRNALANGSYIANITKLDPGTYRIRLIAVNRIGKAQPVLLKSNIIIAPAEDLPKPFPMGAAVGGGLGVPALVILIAILAVIYKRRRNSKLKDDDSRKTILTPKRDPDAKDPDDKTEINLNPMYESSEAVRLPTRNTDVYAQVIKPSFQPSPGTSSDEYSVVNKMKGNDLNSNSKDDTKSDVYSTPKKKEKGKDKKKKRDSGKKKSKTSNQADGMVYENAEITCGKYKGADNVYENPVCGSSDEKPYRTKNDDGLIYIEVDLPQQKDARNKQPVIHGDDRTIYADVAYGQVGEPKPESDEEDK